MNDLTKPPLGEFQIITNKQEERPHQIDEQSSSKSELKKTQNNNPNQRLLSTQTKMHKINLLLLHKAIYPKHSTELIDFTLLCSRHTYFCEEQTIYISYNIYVVNLGFCVIKTLVVSKLNWGSTY